MKKIALLLPALAVACIPLAASAHEVATYQIGSGYYQVVIGSLNEPVAVDDKTGIDLTVTKCRTSACTPAMSADGDMDGPAGTAVSGLDQTLKAELVAGDQKKTVTLSPQYGKDGAYTAAFYPTVATTFSYHFTGTIDNTPVDLTYTCIPEGTPRAALDTTKKSLSSGVTQLSNSGGFGCPVSKEGLGFPKPSASINRITDESSNTKTLSEIALALGVVAVLIGGAAYMRRN